MPDRITVSERNLTSNAELQAIVADYFQQFERRGEPAINRAQPQRARQAAGQPTQAGTRRR